MGKCLIKEQHNKMPVFVGPNSPSPGASDFEAKSDRVGFPNRSSDPSPASAGDVYFDTTSTNKLKVHNGTEFVNQSRYGMDAIRHILIHNVQQQLFAQDGVGDLMFIVIFTGNGLAIDNGYFGFKSTYKYLEPKKFRATQPL